MKRISLLTLVILVSMPFPTEAGSYFPIRYRTRWSTYESGLVTGDVYYSPYAFGISHNGLIPGNVRYSPYAFGTKTSGLVVDPWWPYGFPYFHNLHYSTSDKTSQCTCNKPQHAYANNNYNHFDRMKISSEEEHAARRDRIERQKQTMRKGKTVRTNDARHIIYTYLENSNVGDVETYGILRINNKTVNVSFILKDKNLIVTYWDTDEVESLLQQPGYKRDYYRKHEQTWRSFCEKFIESGGKVYPIISTNREEILAKLAHCDELNDG